MPETLDGMIIAADRPVRMDVFLAEETEYSRNRLQQWIRSGAVSVNGRSVKPNYVLQAGDVIRLCPPQSKETEILAENIPLDILYEDSDICVVNKPQGMVVHPAPGHSGETLVNALLYHMHDLSGIGGEIRPGIVHRIDKMTSGLLVVAKNDAAHLALADQFRLHSAGRSYLAIATGNLREDSGTVRAAIARHPVDRKRMCVDPGGREAVTHWTVLERLGGYTLLRLQLETGRTHQIRVHMSSIGHPLAGDIVYGSKKPQLGLEGQALHGFSLHLVHPAKGSEMHFIAPIPDYFLQALKRIGWRGHQEELERMATQ